MCKTKVISKLSVNIYIYIYIYIYMYVLPSWGNRDSPDFGKKVELSEGEPLQFFLE
ncbi:hypothetical protein K7X86_00320 [Candidatus Sulcia muelleri]|nr:hypothetical protein [Candidatus Karelsulcia muelleri]